MLNINQNFDLKAPVFNFDRDYFNSVEELNAYDTSNVPNHFVTNVAGMLYQFTDGEWLPMLSTMRGGDESYILNLCGATLYSFKDGNGFYPSQLSMWSRNDSNSSIGDGEIQLRGEIDTNGIIMNATDKKIVMYDEEENGHVYIAAKDYDGPEDADRHIAIIASPTTSTYIDLVDGALKATIDTENGFTHTDADEYVCNLTGASLQMYDQIPNTQYMTQVSATGLDVIYQNRLAACIEYGLNKYTIQLGNDGKFKISRPGDNSEGATITGVKSIAAFANPSATKVWATDGSTVDLSTKANASDVLLKKSASGGYYIEENSHELGSKAFAANYACTASGYSSFAEGYGKATSSVSHAEGEYATASGYASHAEGSYTVASATSSHTEGDHTQAAQVSAHAEGYYTTAGGVASHAEGYYTVSNGNYSHAEGYYTKVNSFAAHAQGVYNVDNKNAIHTVGIGNNTTRKNAEYIYAKNDTNSTSLVNDPKNGYKYLIGVGGYDGISTDNTTYKSVQEVIADLTSRIEQLETKVRALEAANTPA